jgi:3'-phosphoadenosine 5'-phosphosulfate sulfotransferase (PAPS reductase)/FAD synthetase
MPTPTNTAAHSDLFSSLVATPDEDSWKELDQDAQFKLVQHNAQVVRDAIATLVAAGALFVVSHSGGKDSDALYAFITSRVPHDQIAVVHADLGEAEQLGTLEHVRASVTHEVHIAKAITKDGEDKWFLDMVLMRAEKLASQGRLDKVSPWPSKGQCSGTSDLKRDPIAKVIRRLSRETGRKLIVECVGRRGLESPRRMRKVVESCKLVDTAAGREWYKIDPIADWDLDTVKATIADAGRKLHATYTKHGFSRMSCCLCVMGSKSDTNIAAKLRPVLFAKYVAVELFVGKNMHSKTVSLEQYAGTKADPKLVAQFTAELQATGRVAQGEPVSYRANGRVSLTVVKAAAPKLTARQTVAVKLLATRGSVSRKDGFGTSQLRSLVAKGLCTTDLQATPLARPPGAPWAL